MFGYILLLVFAIAEIQTTTDRSIVRCSGTKQILAIVRQPWFFFGYFLSIKAKKVTALAVCNKHPQKLINNYLAHK